MRIRKHFRFRKIILFTIASVFLGCGAMGDEALEVMSDDERKFLDQKLSLITKDQTLDDVVEILGPWHREQNGYKYYWLGPDKDEKSQIAIYVWNGKPQKIQWINLGKFAWSKTIKEKD